MMMTKTDNQPWYQQFWPWFLIALPGSVVIACFYTVYLALHHPLSVVQDDYYKEGLAINQNLAADEQASRLGLQASITLLSTQQLQIQLTPMQENDALILQLSHPVDASKDLQLDLIPQANGFYQSVILDAAQWSLLLNEKRWYITLNQTAQQPAWSLRGENHFNLTDPIRLVAQHE